MTKQYTCACGNVVDEVVETVALYNVTLDNIPHYPCSDCGADTIPRKYINKFCLAANKQEEKSELEIAVNILKEEGWTSEEIREAIDKMFNEEGTVIQVDKDGKVIIDWDNPDHVKFYNEWMED